MHLKKSGALSELWLHFVEFQDDFGLHQHRKALAIEASSFASLNWLSALKRVFAMMATQSAAANAPERPQPIQSTNPLPLSASQEQQVRDLYYARVRGKCASEIKSLSTEPFPLCSLYSPFPLPYPTLILPLCLSSPINTPTGFAECAINRTVSATWACRTQRLAMNACMVQHATRDEEDRAREEWFATRLERRREREEKERQIEEKRKFHREWWGLDENGNRTYKDPEQTLKKR
ncbi:MAG: hypothetical protein M1824_005826 [Vezdaea acicularis]|nr:MAG: hypothetical protein M1824_005826 [Vezdaea acicularis]